MSKALASDLLKVLLSFSTIYATTASALPAVSSTGTAPALATGGGGSKPPIYPPTTYSNGGGPSNSGDNRPATGPAPEFGKVWGLDAQGKEIFYEGTRTGTTLQVWKYRSVDRQQVWRGTVQTDPTKPDYQMAKWDRGTQSYDSMRSNLVRQGVTIGLKPGDFVSATGSTRLPGQVAKAASGTEPTYYFMGERTGTQERVWAFLESEHRYIQGLVGQDGRILDIKPFETPVGAPTAQPRFAPGTNLPAVTDGVTYGNTGSGNANVTSPQSERIYWKPSRLQRTMMWTTDKGQSFKRIFMKLNTGTRLVPADSPQGIQETAAEMERLSGPSKGAQLGAGIAAFYAAMGMVAAYELMLEYPNNPMVLEQYFEKFDAMHVLMIGGFMAAAYPFMRKIQGFNSSKNVIRSVPMFAAGLFAGAIGSILISMAADPDVMACTGVTGFIKTHRFGNDMTACDRAYEKFSTEQLAIQLVPKLASIMVTGALFLGSYYLINASGLAAAMRTIPIFKGAKPGPVGLGLMLVSGVIWLASDKISNGLFNVENFVREYMIADGKVENDLFARWEKLRKDGWQDVKPPGSDLPKCQYIPRVGPYPKPCNAGEEYVDFTSVLDRYGSMMASFRNTQLEKTYSAYNNWSSKVSSYHAQIGAAYDLYANFVDRVDYESKNPGLSENDARGFNSVTIRNLERARINGNIYPGDKMASGWELQMGLDKDHVVESDPVYTQDFTGTWKYVGTRNFFDYVVTSMACGPEVEGQSDNSILQSIGLFMSSWVTGNTAPSNIVGEPSGQALIFHPPRVTKPLAGTNRTVCEKYFGRDAILDTLITPLPSRPENFAVINGLFSSEKDYKNLYAYIKENVRASVLTGGTNNFDTWWDSAVTVPTAQMEDTLRAEYEKMLKDTYVPALQNPKYYWCEERDTTGLGFFPHWLKLSPAGGANCGPTRLHRLSHGLVDSLRDELRLYMALAIDLYASTPQGTAATAPQTAVQTATERAKAVLDALDQYIIRATFVDGRMRADAELARLDASQKLEDFKAQMLKVEDGQIYTRQQEWMKLLFTKIDPILTQTRIFYTILKAFEPPTAIDLAAPATAPESASN